MAEILEFFKKLIGMKPEPVVAATVTGKTGKTSTGGRAGRVTHSISHVPELKENWTKVVEREKK